MQSILNSAFSRMRAGWGGGVGVQRCRNSPVDRSCVSVNKRRHSKWLHQMCEEVSQPISCRALPSFSCLLGTWQIWTNRCHKIIPALASQTNKQINNWYVRSAPTRFFLPRTCLRGGKWDGRHRGQSGFCWTAELE